MTYKQILKQRAKKNVSTKALDKFSPYEIIITPVVTEKTHKTQQDHNQYTFKVHKDANKNDVKRALEYVYNVTPIKTNIINVKFKGRFQRKLVRKAYKKAIVTLAKGDKIEFGA